MVLEMLIFLTKTEKWIFMHDCSINASISIIMPPLPLPRRQNAPFTQTYNLTCFSLKHFIVFHHTPLSISGNMFRLFCSAMSAVSQSFHELCGLETPNGKQVVCVGAASSNFSSLGCNIACAL